MQNIAIRLTNYFIRKGIISETERDIYEYGFDITIYTIVSTLGILLLGLVLRRFWESAVLMAIFYACQSSGGGYHASTHLRCFLTMCFGLLAGLGFTLLPCPLWVLCALALLAVIVLLVIPLTLHPNKQYLAENRKALVLRSRVSVVVSFALAVVLAALQWIPASVVTAGYLLAAISRLYAKAHYPSATKESSASDSE
jgi:accessory gene regulator B